MLNVALHLKMPVRFAVNLIATVAFVVTAPAVFAQLIEDEDGPVPVRSSTSANATRVTGRVTDSKGQPVANAEIVIVAAEYARFARPTGVSIERLHGGDSLPRSFELFGPVMADHSGNFQIDVPESRTGVYAGLDLWATAQGHGCAIINLHQTAGRKPLEIQLSPEHVLRGKVIDLNGQPATGVSVYPEFLASRESGLFSARRPLRHMLDVWKPVTTDDKGRFLIRGVCPKREGGAVGRLHIEGANYTPLQSYTEPVSIDSEESAILSLSPPKRIHGKVTFADTGKPVANAKVVATVLPGGLGEWIETRTDANGDYSIIPYATGDRDGGVRRKQVPLNVFPPAGEKYLVAQEIVPDFRGTTQQHDVKLQRGILVRGKVTERVTGEPVAHARIQFIPKRLRTELGFAVGESGGVQTAISRADGTYELPVPARLGHLLVLAPTLDYLRVESSNQEIHDGGQRGKARWSANAVTKIDLKQAGVEHKFDFVLNKGVRLGGRVFDPAGEPADEFVMMSSSYIAVGYQYSYSGAGNWRHCRDGNFELPGCDPEQTHIVYLYDWKRALGATFELTRQHEAEPATVKLQPCGTAHARFLDANGKPNPTPPITFSCMLTDGAPHRLYRGDKHDYPLEADVIHLYNLGPYPKPDNETSGDARYLFPSLIPGAKYMFHWAPNDRGSENSWPSLVFSVGAGEKKDLGDIDLNSGRAKQQQ